MRFLKYIILFFINNRMDSLFSKYSNSLKSNYNEINPEDKSDADLTTSDRIYLIQKTNNNNSNKITDILSNKLLLNKSVEIDNNFFQDLEIFSDNTNKDDNSIFKKIDNTVTTMGKNTLKNILLNPIKNIDILEKRQLIIKNINKDDYKAINENLKNIYKLEEDLSWFWNDSTAEHLKILDDMVFLNIGNISMINNYVNKNEQLLNIVSFYKIYIAPFITVITPLLSIIIPLVLFKVGQYKIPALRKISTTTYLKTIIKGLFNTKHYEIFIKDKIKAKMVGFLSMGLWAFFYLQSTYYSVTTAINTSKIINIFHNKLNSVYNIILNSYNIFKIFKKNNPIIYQLFNISKSVGNDFYNLMYILNNETFKKSPTALSNKGRILSVYKKIIMERNKESLLNILYYVGIIDYFQSLHYLLDLRDSDNKYSLTTYLDTDKPKINFKKLWHPYLIDNPVTNSLNMKNNSILITGPNAAGKSTFIKAIALNILLSQTIGISAANKFELTPFKILETYLHLPDIKGKSSLFEVEMNRSKNYIEKIKNLGENEFSFIIMDELFSSTNYIEGFSGAYAIIKKLVSIDNSMSCITTHYSDLSKLEKITNKKIKNYNFKITRNEKNEIQYDYKIHPGISRQYIALELLANNDFDKDIINDAILISKKLLQKEKKKFKKKKNLKKKIKNNGH